MTPEEKLQRRREAQRRYLARKRNMGGRVMREPDTLPEKRYFHVKIDVVKYWPKLCGIMAAHPNWTVRRCKAELAKKLDQQNENS